MQHSQRIHIIHVLVIDSAVVSTSHIVSQIVVADQSEQFV